MKRIVFKVSPDGKDTTIEAYDHTGAECEHATAPYREALGGPQTAEQKKPEYYTVSGQKVVQEATQRA